MNKPTKIVIAGAGGLGREILSSLKACNAISKEWSILGFLDSDPTLTGSKLAGVPVLGSDDWCRNNNHKEIRFICALGNSRARHKLVQKLTRLHCKFASVVHPDVPIPESVQIGVGTTVMAGTRFTADAKIGSHVVIYLNCSITHDVCISDFCLIPSGCNLSGGVVLEKGVELGTGVSILPGRRIGAWTIIGAGSVVTEDIPGDSTAVGVPCRVISRRRRHAAAD